MGSKTVIVTGAGSGIGKAIATKFAINNYQVVIADLNEESGNETLKEIESNGGKAIFVKTDASDPRSCESLVKKTIETYGGLDCAVNNAGISSVGIKTGEYPIDKWNHEIAVNLNGVFYGMRHQIPEILKTKGAIVNIASVLGVTAIPLSPAYVAAKHGVVGLTKTAALEYAQQGIRINVVGPGYTETPLLAHYTEEKRNSVIARHPMGRLAKPDEIANMVYWLGSEETSYVIGAYFAVDGGYTAQ